jgi:uncharacterized protein YndB with AHSA1/START domain
MSNTNTQHLQIAVKASRDQVWDALVDGDTTPAYYFGFRAEYDLTSGAPYRYTAGGGEVIFGKVLSVDPGHELAVTFNGRWSAAVAELPESRVTISLADPKWPLPGITMLSLVHEDLAGGAVAADLEAGWVTILSGLKTLLETGQPMTAAPA